MRILFVTPQSPDPIGGGAAIRNWHLIHAAQQAGHRVEVVALHNHDHDHDRVETAAIPHVPVTMLPFAQRNHWERLRDLFRIAPDLARRLDGGSHAVSIALQLYHASQSDDPFDLIQVEGLEMWSILPTADLDHLDTAARGAHGDNVMLRPSDMMLASPSLPPVIYDAHNAETTLQRRTAVNALRTRHVIGASYSVMQWAKLRRYERDVVRTATATLALSPNDARALETLSGQAQAVDVVPVGVDTTYFSPDAPGLPPPIPFDVVFSGTLDYRPNADAARWLVREVWPLLRAVHPAATLALVGRNPLPELRAYDGQHGITVTGAVPDDRPYMTGAAVYALPMRFGAGVRLKLLNAMSMGCVVVATPAAVDGITVQNGRDLLLVPPDARGFAASIAAVLNAPAIRTRYGAAARRLMVAQHDWSRVTPALLAVYDRIERDHVRV